MTIRCGIVLLLPILLCACPPDLPLPGPVAQLDRFKEAEQEGQFDDIANTVPDQDCTAPFQSSQACPEIAEIRGRACMRLARNALSYGSAIPGLLTACPLTDQREHLDCAASNFALARQSTTFSPMQSEEMGEMQAQALYCESAMSASVQREALSRSAIDTLDRIGANARRDDLSANLALSLARNPQTPEEERCRWARQAMMAADHGLKSDPSPEIRAGLNAVRSGASDVAVADRCVGG